MVATRKPRTSTKAAPEVVEPTEAEETVAEPTFKQLATEAINDATAQLKVEAKDRYKVQRAFGYIAIQNAIADGTLDELTAQVVAEAGDLPSGFGLERPVAAEKPAPKAKAAPAGKSKATPAKAPAAKAGRAAAKPAASTARKRPTR